MPSNETSQRPRSVLITAAFALFALSAALDFWSPSDLTAALFYAPPVLLAIAFGGTVWGIIAALAATGLWAVMVAVQGQHFSGPFVWTWNILFRLCFFLMLPLLARLQRLRELERAARAESAAAVRLKTRMVAMVSREFGSALTDFQTALAVLKDSEPSLTEERRLNYDLLDQLVRRWDLTITNFLGLSRLESGFFELNRSKVPVVTMIRDVVGVLRPLIERKSLSVAVETPEKEGFGVDADPEALRMILGNLLSNTVKFAPLHAKIRIRVERSAEEAPETLIAIEQSGAVELKPVEAGVGVNISRELVESHGSRLSLQDRPEGGFRFSFRLPAA